EVFLGREMGLRERQVCSEQTSALIDAEVRRQINACYTSVRQLLSEHREELDRLARALLEQEVLDEGQLQALVRGLPYAVEPASEGGAPGDALAIPAGKS
ncbi:MAG TPA: hypothetical protein VGF67_19555, partial [Ktedonobacteraceae bacterium]